jgi:hypothetical protein
MVSRRQRSSAHGQALALGQARELGEHRFSCHRTNRVARRSWGLFLTLFGVFPGVSIAAAASATGHLEPVLVAGFGGFVALGVVLFKTAPREGTDWVHVYSGGLAEITGAPSGEVVRVLPWNLLDHVLREYSTSSSETDPDLSAIHLACADGSTLSIDSGYPGIYRLDRYFSEMLVAQRLPAALARAGTGAPVWFGGLSVSQTGIAWGGGAHSVGWQDMRWIRVTPWQIEIATTLPRGRQKFWLNDIPDAYVAVLLIHQLAVRLRVRQRSAWPKQFPALPERA